ncbi:MAG: ABC transporter permease [Armatimonadota bacterium]|nr:ABC transporter permease [Armatimonadota bacterium]MDR7451848.1 ABC transporter permease [Armatimonadota bacterium]MDR7467573.1 ABC transporter permease [Armatimonadota bacterium]MDR7494466.1 ABC transporter permease [Armatimonadota bacterium]MDR7499727.1 ABC transporter permease [Armatimonadota bacterium]
MNAVALPGIRGDIRSLGAAVQGRPYLALAALPVAFFGVFLLYPLALMFLVSIRNYAPAQIVGDRITLENYLRFLLDPFYRRILLSTLRLAAVVSATALLLAYPLAYYLSRTTSRAKGWLIFLLLTPLMVGIVVRTYGWIVLLGRSGTVNQLLLALGVVREPVRILFTETAVVLGLIEVLLPYMIFPLISALQKVDPTLEAAAATLGAGPLEVLRRVVLPLSLPGIVSGTVIVFTLSAGAIVTPAILGGPRTQTMGTLIYQLMTATLNWPFGSAVAFILLAFEAFPVFLFFAVTARGRGGRGP